MLCSKDIYEINVLDMVPLNAANDVTVFGHIKAVAMIHANVSLDIHYFVAEFEYNPFDLCTDLGTQYQCNNV